MPPLLAVACGREQEGKKSARWWEGRRLARRSAARGARTARLPAAGRSSVPLGPGACVPPGKPPPHAVPMPPRPVGTIPGAQASISCMHVCTHVPTKCACMPPLASRRPSGWKAAAVMAVHDSWPQHTMLLPRSAPDASDSSLQPVRGTTRCQDVQDVHAAARHWQLVHAGAAGGRRERGEASKGCGSRAETWRRL